MTEKCAIEATKSEQELDKLYNLLIETLKHHDLSYTFIDVEDGDGDGDGEDGDPLPLVDALTPAGDGNISRGIDEISYISEALIDAIMSWRGFAAGPWQPMSTVPEAGTLVLLKVGAGVYAATKRDDGEYELWGGYRFGADNPDMWARINTPEEETE